MKRIILSIFALMLTVGTWAQESNKYLEAVKADPQKSYGTDYPYGFEMGELTKSPKGYKPFYISHYARHGSRYYWNDQLYKQLDTLLTAAYNQQKLTAEGEAFYKRFVGVKDELMTGVSELSERGWQQHQTIARTMYNRFPEVFKKGGHIMAISSLSGRCVISMSAFCQELTQCNPALEIREQSSRFTLNAVVPDDKQNPKFKEFPTVKPRYEKSSIKIPHDGSLYKNITNRVFTTTEGLPGAQWIAGNLKNLYTSLPNINHEGLMGNIVTDDEIVKDWEVSNLGSYSWVFSLQYKMIPILEDILKKAQDVIEGRNADVASLRFGHDSCLGPLTVLMGLNGADLDPENPYEVKNCYQNYQTCKASNIQLIFYRSKKAGSDILVKCLLNGSEATMPVATDMFPYYKWKDVYDFYSKRCKEHQ